VVPSRLETGKVADTSKRSSAEITSPEFWEAFWSSVAYSELKEDDPHYGPRGYFLKAMDRHCGSLVGKSLLELGGCMSQRLIALAKYRDMKATAIDYAPAACEKSRQFFYRNGREIEVLCGDFFSREFDGKQFDLVTHWGVLEHQVDPIPLIRRSVEFCAPGGKLIFSMPQMRGPGAWLWRKFSPSTWANHIYHPDQKILECFSQLQWTCKPIFFGPPLIHMTPSDLKGALGWFLEKCQNLAGYYFARAGMPYQYGLPFISANRGFVACKQTR
jgi:2-polyprenyl-3-methyl-5-hydroxy-6-metoxy-1,4-benzoquinol methylase